MRLLTDDSLRDTDSYWLGPDGYTWPFRATYAQWVVALLVAGPIFLLERALGIHPIETFVVILLIVVVAASKAIVRCSSFDEPARLLPVMLWHEVGAPREPKAFATVVSVAKVRVTA